MIITVLNVEETTKKNKNGKNYSQLEIAYKDENGKVTSKKIFSFSFPECFDVLKQAKKDQVFDINSVKNNDTGYWDWVQAKLFDAPFTPTPADPDQPSKSNKTNTYSDPRETKQERVQRQRMIVRQSSLSNAISFNNGASVEEMLQTAETFENWVMRETARNLMQGLGELGLMDDDVNF